MTGSIAQLLAADHDRLDALLARASRNDGTIDTDAYLAFRAGLARHIGMEEKILFPAARRHGGSDAELKLERLRADHGKLVSLLIWIPTSATVEEIRAILEPHNRLEEDFVYTACERLLDTEADAVRAALEAAPEVPMRPLLPPRRAAAR